MPDRPARRDRLRGGDDRVGVDAVVPVEVGERAGLAEMLDAERAHAMAVRPRRARPASPDGRRARVTMPQCGGTSASSRSICERACTRPRSRARCAAVQPALSRSAEVTASSPTSRRSSRHQADRLDRFRRDRAGIGDDHLRIRARLAQPIGAVDDLLRAARRVIARSSARSAASRAADRPSRRSRRAASCAPTAPVAILLDVVEGPAQDDRELVDKGRLERGKPVLRHADQRLRRSTDARRLRRRSVMPDGVATTMKRASW